MPIERKELYTPAEVAEIFDVKPETVRDWLASGKLKGFHLGGPGGRWRIRDTEVERLANEQHGA